MSTEAKMLQWEKEYAERSGFTVEQLHLGGAFARPCDCGEWACEGFAMWRPHDLAMFEDEFGPLPDLGYGGAPARPAEEQAPSSAP